METANHKQELLDKTEELFRQLAEPLGFLQYQNAVVLNDNAAADGGALTAVSCTYSELKCAFMHYHITGRRSRGDTNTCYIMISVDAVNKHTVEVYAKSRWRRCMELLLWTAMSGNPNDYNFVLNYNNLSWVLWR